MESEGVGTMCEKELEDKIIKLLPKTSLFGGVNLEDIRFFIDDLVERKYVKGENIIEEGGSPGDSYILLEGEVILTVHGRRVNKFGPGTVFGVDSQVGIQKQITTATAYTDVSLAVIPKMTLYILQKKRPELFEKLILNVARDFARSLRGMKEIIADYILLEEKGLL
jgi:CRP-like cAMP-binding protein